MKSFSNNLSAVLAIVVLTAVSVISIMPAGAAEDPATVIKQRKAQMKEIVLKNLKAMKQMVEDDFIDAGEAAKGMSAIAKVAEGFAARFPKGTETGFETTASPRIWQDNAGFRKRLAKLAADAKAASIAAGKGDDAFKVAFVTVAKNCKGCHEAYRIKKK